MIRKMCKFHCTVVTKILKHFGILYIHYCNCDVLNTTFNPPGQDQQRHHPAAVVSAQHGRSERIRLGPVEVSVSICAVYHARLQFALLALKHRGKY